MESFFLNQELQAMLKIGKAGVSKNIRLVLLHLLDKGEITKGEYEWAKAKIQGGIHIRS
ncbi:hypothetical protein [Salinithrix halophila]|uniref:Fur-regulated basic protein A n=1 Tax=Salinithrix halophila TaxID=1485204 RepID=A0ABV8JDB2_9BACL